MIHVTKEETKLTGSLNEILNDLGNAASGVMSSLLDLFPEEVAANLVSAAVAIGMANAQSKKNPDRENKEEEVDG